MLTPMRPNQKKEKKRSAADKMKFNRDILEKSEVLATLGQGRLATTTLRDKEGVKFVAKQYKARFAGLARNEYLFLQAARGANVVKALAYLPLEEPVIITEYLEGSNLKPESFPGKKDAEACFARLATTIAALHAAGICVNDIKPDNIVVQGKTPFLTDLGLATANLFFEREFRGTPAYAAPEKFIRQTNHFAADVFSLGMTMFFCRHGQTLLDLVREDEYNRLIAKEDLWQKHLENAESDALILRMLAYRPEARLQAIDAALEMAGRHKLDLTSLELPLVESYVFKTQKAAAEKLGKRGLLRCDYADEPQVIENLLSLWSESNGKKLAVLDESCFVSQPEEFFRSFPFGYRDKNVYQPNFIEWLKEQPLTVLLRRHSQLAPTSFFDEIASRTGALQLWIGENSEVKPVAFSETASLMASVPSLRERQNSLRKSLPSAKPFYVRLALLGLLQSGQSTLPENELTDFLAWIRIPIPLLLAEKIWENWYILIQDALLRKKISFEAGMVRGKSDQSGSPTPSPDLVARALDHACKAGFFHIAGEISHLQKKTAQALDYWTQHIDALTRNEYFLSAYEFIQQLRQRVKTFPFEIRKKEAFLARISGHFELSNRLYEQLISESEGTLRAVLSVDRAIVLQALKRHEEAISSYKNAIDLFRLHKDQKSLFRALNNLGVVYFGLQRYADAEQIFNDVLSEARQQKNIQFEAVSYLNLSDIQLKRGEWQRVLYYTDKAIDLTYQNQKWNLYANGSVIRSRALFALGEHSQAIHILQELRDNPKISENLLQYQEITAWLLHFLEIYDSGAADKLMDSLSISDSTMHEILRRELFFLSLARRKYYQAQLHLQELAEVQILKAFFNTETDTVIDLLNDLKTQVELDSYFYYLTWFIRLYPETALSRLRDDIQEAVNLYACKPLTHLLENSELPGRQAAFWMELVQQISSASSSEEMVEYVLQHARRTIKAEKHVYFEVRGGTLVPVMALDENGRPIPPDQLLLSQKVLRLVSELDGYFYIYPVYEQLGSEAHSSVLGLGIATVCGYAVRRQGALRGIFYCDAGRNLDLDESARTQCRILFYFVQNSLELLAQAGRQDNAPAIGLPDAETASLAMVGKSKVMREVYAKIALVAGHNVNVLITGPTGSGKELVAREIHHQYTAKNRAGRKVPFVAVNCAAIPEQLLESELFGYKKGAFTGANADKKGKLLLADGGTLFLDEIGEMPLLLQSKLLRAIQEKQITPLGSDQDVPVNVRIIAATNQNLEELIAQNAFRADLYYRLKVMTIDLPALSERKDDIPLLVMAFLKKFNEKFQKQVSGIHPSALSYLQNREWKGNVRELENEVERAVLICRRDYLETADFTAGADPSAGALFRNLPLNWQQFRQYKKRVEEELDQRYIKLLLEEAGDNILAASKLGNLDRMQIYRLLKKNPEQS